MKAESFELRSSEAVMAEHGKSFYFASRFFTRSELERVSQLYHLCRWIDDVADLSGPEEARKSIAAFRAQMDTQSSDRTPFLAAVKSVESYGVEQNHLLELLAGAEFDAKQMVIEDQQQFLKYCSQVAGVVGLMMCPLLGVKDSRAYPHAHALGVAMQITNICRDVVEDALRGRIYFPLSVRVELRDRAFTENPTPDSVRAIIKIYLDLAEEYYRKAYLGLCYLPFRARICIAVAGELYRHIGIKIRRIDYNVAEGRQFLTFREKVVVSFRLLGFLLRRRFWFKPPLLENAAP